MFLYVFYKFYIVFIGFCKFSTEELRLATGASVPVARKQKVVISFYRRNSEGNVYCFTGFSKKYPPPSRENSQLSMKKSVFAPPHLRWGY